MGRTKKNELFFRVDDETFEKFNTVLDAQNKLFEKMGAVKISKAFLFEKLIHDEYLKFLNKQKDPETTDRINMMVDTRLEHAFRIRDKYLQEILFENRKTNAILKILLNKHNINIHNTDIVEQLASKSEVEQIIERHIAKEVFGTDKNKTEKTTPKPSEPIKEFEPDYETVDEDLYDDVDLDGYDESQSQELTIEEIKMIMNDYYADEDSEE